MKRHLNTLFVTTQGAYLHRDNDNVVVSVDRSERLRLPIHTLGSIVCFGNVLTSPGLLGHCAENRVHVSFLTESGRFLARVQGRTQGNVLLRRQQYRLADDSASATAIARTFVVTKVANAVSQLRRFARDHHPEGHPGVEAAIRRMKRLIERAQTADDRDTLRGYEGEAARVYFGVYDEMILADKDVFAFNGRNRRPPTDPTNALMSFLYTIVVHDMESAIEVVGLDPAVGFLHEDRPGRPSLALDMIEDMRAWLADRVALTLINRGQLKKGDFEHQVTGAVLLTTEGRKKVLTAYQQRKQEEVQHGFLGERVTIGTLFFVQALLFARRIRGDLDDYPAYIPR